MYRAEFFDYKMVYKDFAVFDDDTELSIDYLAWDASQIHVYNKAVRTVKSDLVHVTRDGKTIFDGYVNAISYPAKNEMQIDVLPLLCSFRFASYFEAHKQACTDLAKWIYDEFRDRYVGGFEPYVDSGGHTHQDGSWIIPFSISSTVIEGSRPYAYNDEFCLIAGTKMFADLLTRWRVLVSASLNMRSKTVSVTLSQRTEAVTIEADLDNIVERSVSLGNSYGSTNKMAIFNPNDGDSYAQVFYLHPDGTVDAMSTNRIEPVVEAMEKIDSSDTWAAEALQKAKDTMIPAQYDNEIDLTVADDDAIVRPEELPIGTLATIRTGGAEYQSLLTGKTRNNHLITLIFGSVRVDLTKQLSMERSK